MTPYDIQTQLHFVQYRTVGKPAIDRQAIINSSRQSMTTPRQPRVSALSLELEATIALRTQTCPGFVPSPTSPIHLYRLGLTKDHDPRIRDNDPHF